MIREVTEKEIIRLLKKKYKSWGNPKFSFLKEAVRVREYDPIIDTIGTEFHVEETTDLNEDVSFCYTVSTQDSDLGLQISMLGPYYIILKQDENTQIIELVTHSNCSSEEGKLISILDVYGLTMLTKDELEIRVDLELYYTEKENVRVYQALFSDNDYLPWEYSTTKTSIEPNEGVQTKVRVHIDNKKRIHGYPCGPEQFKK